jgi:ATP-dependent exoDNAse (exonuclease V) beta subunit
LGDKIHELFSQVIDIKSFELPENLDEEVKIQFLLCMKNPEIRALLSAEMPDDVWLEKRFDCIINDGWVSGCFDRVNLIRNDAGKVIRAQLIDYKSSYLDDDNYELKVKNYKRQLNLYRDVLAKILKFSTSDIDCFMIFCRYGKMEKF